MTAPGHSVVSPARADVTCYCAREALVPDICPAVTVPVRDAGTEARAIICRGRGTPAGIATTIGDTATPGITTTRGAAAAPGIATPSGASTACAGAPLRPVTRANASGCLPSGEIDQCRGFIRKWFLLALLLRRVGTFFQVSGTPLRLGRRSGHSALEPGEPLGDECINKGSNAIAGVLRNVERITTQGRDHFIYRMLSVKQPPDVDAGGAQAETTTGIGVKENRPVVKLLTEQDVMVGYRSVTVLDRSASVLPSDIAPYGVTPVAEIKR